MKNVKNRSKFHEKWPFFIHYLAMNEHNGSEKSFLLIFSARDDVVKVSWNLMEVPKPTYPSLLWASEWKEPAPLKSFSLIDFGLWLNHLLRQVLHSSSWWPWTTHRHVLQRLVSQNSFSTYLISFSCFSSHLQASAASSQNLLFLSASSFFQSLCPGQPLSTGWWGILKIIITQTNKTPLQYVNR